MYLTHFGLRARPFRPAPVAELYYPATAHEIVLDRLLHAIADDEGLMLLTAEPGLGKTLIAHRLLERTGENITSILITNCRFNTRADFFRAILFDLGRPFNATGEQELRLNLMEAILDQVAQGKRILLVLDEAQDLTIDLLEELRLMSNIEGRGGKALAILFVAQPSIHETLRLPQLHLMNHRLAHRQSLRPLGMTEAADYVLHQIRAVGGRPDEIIDDVAVQLLARHTNGNPRLLNQAAHLAFELAHLAEAETVDAEAAIEALIQFGIEVSEDAASIGDHDETDDDDDNPGLGATLPPSPGPSGVIGGKKTDWSAGPIIVKPKGSGNGPFVYPRPSNS